MSHYNFCRVDCPSGERENQSRPAGHPMQLRYRKRTLLCSVSHR